MLVGRWRPGTVLAIGRAGLFCSTDQGGHWASARLEPLNPKGQTYCRDIREVPGDPRTIWVAGGANFQSDVGALFRSKDGGASWTRVDMGVKPKATIDGVVRDPSLFGITTTSPPSITATQLFVVPRSMPMTLPIVLYPPSPAGAGVATATMAGRTSRPCHPRSSPPADQ